MKPRSRFGKAVMILVFCAAFVTVFSFIVMSLWNAILPAVLGVKAITFWQAMGILVLSKILFGGFGGWGHKREQFKHKWKQRMQTKWASMSPEERQKFVNVWKSRCADWKNPFDEEHPGSKENIGTQKPGPDM